MHDLRGIRRNPEAFAAAMARRGVSGGAVGALFVADAERRARADRVQELRGDLNRAAAATGAAPAIGADGDVLAGLLAAGERASVELGRREPAAAETGARTVAEAERMPNVLAVDVPPGRGEEGNVVLKTSGGAGAELAGSRFCVPRGGMARLERAPGQFMLDLRVGTHGYEEVAVPHMMPPEMLRGIGQLPKFAGDLFPAGESRFLIPTAEAPLTNLARSGAVDPAAPARLAALTPCYRSEVGSAGRDVRGILRQHQFHKVELVSVTAPEDAEAEHERMTRCAETVLDLLGLPYRRILLCAGDTGFSAARTYDIEVWMAGQEAWREIISCSTCGDFQARRMEPRLKGRKDLPHTLNGSGVAVGRALAAVLENFLREDGSVPVPEALRPWTGGLDILRPRQPTLEA